jgi:hypothetical protein
MKPDLRSTLKVRRLPPHIGKLGYGLIGVGVVLAYLSLAVGKSIWAFVLVFGGSFLYLIGGFLAVASFDYTRGSRPMLVLRVSRVAIALAVVWFFMKNFGSPV